MADIRTNAKTGETLPRQADAARRRPLPAVACLCAVSALTIFHAVRCLLLLDSCPMRYDESWTFLFYVLPGGPEGWFNYSAPNNHIFHTLLAALSTAIGGDGPAALRFPAYLAGVAVVPAAAWLTRKLGASRPAAVLSALMAAQSVALVEYTVNARGYSLLCLDSILMAVCTLNILDRPVQWRAWICWMILAVLGLFTIPTMLYPIAILSTVILIHFIFFTDRSSLRKVIVRLGASLLAAGLLACLLYLPAVIYTAEGVEAITSNRFVTPVALDKVFSDLPAAAGMTLTEWTQGLAWPWVAMAIAGLAAAVVWAILSRTAFCLLPVLGPILLAGLAVAQRVVPFSRVWLFLLPMLIAVSAWGLDKLAGCLSSLLKRAFLSWHGRPGRVSQGRLAPGDQKKTKTATTGTVVEHTGKMPVPLLKRVVFIAAWSAIFILAALTGADPVGRAARTGLIDPNDKDTIRDARQIARDLADKKLNDTATVSLWISRWPLAYYEVLYRSQPMQYRNVYEVIDFANPRYTSALIVVGRGQTLQQVLDEKPGFFKLYNQPRPWRHYLDCETYLADRKILNSQP
ncbi:MAG: hypothetical protein HZA50_07385 [Planctomycetes bacterium]|nr:hypothetical protein [Planctomycetota bacterium]